MTVENITVERLRELLHYDPETGILTWRVRKSQRCKPGMEAGYLVHGYRYVEIDGRAHPAHHLAWFYMTGEWPSDQVDHRDLDQSNNRFENLRECNTSQNKANIRKPVTNTSGFKGVSYFPQSNKWRALIRARGRRYSLGLFDNPEEAHRAYAIAARKHFGEFARAE